MFRSACLWRAPSSARARAIQAPCALPLGRAARIYEVLPLLCPLWGCQMRIIAFITHSADIRQILDHIGVASAPPRVLPALGPALWVRLRRPLLISRLSYKRLAVGEAARAQTAQTNSAWKPCTRATLAFMRLNFLSVPRTKRAKS